MNLPIRSAVTSLKNLPQFRGLPASRLPALQPPRGNALAPPVPTVDPAKIGALTSTMKEQFAAKAEDPRAFHDLMSSVFGAGYDQQKAESLRQKALAGDFAWLPPVRLIDAATLHGARGAYDAQNGVVYLNAELVATNPKLAASVYVEEAGAHLDVMLNRSDAAGDEGELFRRLIGGEVLSKEAIASIRADDDHGTIVVDGKRVAVEFSTPVGAALDFLPGGGALGAVIDGLSLFGDVVKETVGQMFATLKNAGGTPKF